MSQSAFNPRVPECIEMVSTMVDKHPYVLNWATLDFRILEFYDARYGYDALTQIVPVLNLNFK